MNWTWQSYTLDCFESNSLSLFLHNVAQVDTTTASAIYYA